MNKINQIKELNFSGPHITASVIENVKDFYIDQRTIVLNPTMNGAIIDGQPQKSLLPMNSSIYKEIFIVKADLLILLSVDNDINLGNIILEDGWSLLGALLEPAKSNDNAKEKAFPTNTPLWKSPQDDVKIVKLDPRQLTGQTDKSTSEQNFLIKLNLWFATAKTHCFIHNKHDFIEIHTQVCGTGRMQKFKAQDFNTLYEDTMMPKGYTTQTPYCNVNDKDSYIYPWHQYYADTDCIWMAVEFHPV